VAHGQVVVVEGVVVQGGIIVILKIVMRLRRRPVVAVVVEQRKGREVRVVILKQGLRKQGKRQRQGLVREVRVQPQVLHQGAMEGEGVNMVKRHLHNRVMGDMVEISILIQRVLVVQMGQYGKVVGAVGTSIKDYTLNLI
jgi:hypothetical protein